MRAAQYEPTTTVIAPEPVQVVAEVLPVLRGVAALSDADKETLVRTTVTCESAKLPTLNHTNHSRSPKPDSGTV